MYPLEPARKASHRQDVGAQTDGPSWICRPPHLRLAIRYRTRQNKTEQTISKGLRLNERLKLRAQAADGGNSAREGVQIPVSRLPKRVSDRLQGKGWLGWISMTRLNLSEAWDLPAVRRCVLLQPASHTRRCGNRCESRFGC